MRNFFLNFCALLVLSFFFFPFELVIIPGANSKMILAAVGVVMLIYNSSIRRDASVDKGLFVIILYALIVSLSGLLSVICNHTSDYSYASYFMSMAVWLAAAYVVITVVKVVHTGVTVRLICNYLVVLCVVQCVLALLIDSFPFLSSIVSKIMVVTPAMEGRLYGIDASLDIAGTRFSAILIMLVHCLLCGKGKADNTFGYNLWNIFAFIIISIVGNMISRTTLVGVILAILYFVYIWVRGTSLRVRKIALIFVSILMLVVPIISLLYRVNHDFHDHLRFGFEGFFAWAETGQWETNSNNILLDMIVFPDNLKTWIIGDGYFANPYHTDPYYVGPKTGGFYMGTDIGYLRFIFYFGLIGLSAFVLYFIRIVVELCGRYPEYKAMFIVLLLLNFIIWFKVSTDIFVVFALFICLGETDEEEIEAL